MSNLKSRILKLFIDTSGEELLRIPTSLQKDLEDSLQDNEKIVHNLRTYKATYKAKRILDSNSYFNAIMILTNQRMIVARNSSRLKKFRDVPLNLIQNQTLEISEDIPILTMNLSNTKDILTFPKNSKEQVEPVVKTLKELLENNANKSTQKIFCRYCGKKVPEDSQFCQECGKELK